MKGDTSVLLGVKGLSIKSFKCFRFGPSEHSLTIASSPPQELIFSQFLGEINVRVSCLQACPSEIPVTLSLAGKDGSAVTLSAKPTASGKLTASVTFRDVLPGSYEVAARKDDWCWLDRTVKAEVNMKNVDIKLQQSGYLLTVSSSHSTLLPYTVKDQKGTVEVQKGATKTCLSVPGQYVFTPEGCHKFAEAQYPWATSAPSLLSLVATHHTLSGVVKSSQAGSFEVKIAEKGKSSSEVQPCKKIGNKFFFKTKCARK